MAEQYIGPYRVVREIGRGGMGAVFEAVQPQIERRVAIKVLHSQFAQNAQLVHRFFQEARAVNIVNHPSVVQITELAQLPDGTAYIVMEFLEGESLGSRMKRQGGKLSIVEGEWKLPRLVIIEFPSREKAEAWYRSPEYQKVLPLRLKSSAGNLVIVDGAE